MTGQDHTTEVCDIERNLIGWHHPTVSTHMHSVKGIFRLRHFALSCVALYVQLSGLGSSVGRASAWNAECRRFEFHLRQLIFLCKMTTYILGCIALRVSWFMYIQHWGHV